MLKEIYLYDDSILYSFRGRIHQPDPTMAGIDKFEDKIKNLERIISEKQPPDYSGQPSAHQQVTRAKLVVAAVEKRVHRHRPIPILGCE